MTAGEEGKGFLLKKSWQRRREASNRLKFTSAESVSRRNLSIGIQTWKRTALACAILVSSSAKAQAAAKSR
jgi:hypothetical protein